MDMANFQSYEFSFKKQLSFKWYDNLKHINYRDDSTQHQ